MLEIRPCEQFISNVHFSKGVRASIKVIVPTNASAHNLETPIGFA